MYIPVISTIKNYSVFFNISSHTFSLNPRCHKSISNHPHVFRWDIPVFPYQTKT